VWFQLILSCSELPQTLSRKRKDVHCSRLHATPERSALYLSKGLSKTPISVGQSAIKDTMDNAN
jgi:hypothetical protein